ncbi:MAG: hypothetical protein OJF62_001086 [Pseudolabrys sp.]|nr:hypothetical protein [Pseudolabrys sp.]
MHRGHAFVGHSFNEGITVLDIQDPSKPKVVNFVGCAPDAVKAIKAGRLLATVSYDALSLIAIALQAAIRILDGKPVAKVIELPAGIIDISNCEVWNRPYEERPLPMWDDVVTADFVPSDGPPIN